jgi:hypothetical protein
MKWYDPVIPFATLLVVSSILTHRLCLRVFGVVVDLRMWIIQCWQCSVATLGSPPFAESSVYRVFHVGPEWTGRVAAQTAALEHRPNSDRPGGRPVGAVGGAASVAQGRRSQLPVAPESVCRPSWRGGGSIPCMQVTLGLANPILDTPCYRRRQVSLVGTMTEAGTGSNAGAALHASAAAIALGGEDNGRSPEPCEKEISDGSPPLVTPYTYPPPKGLLERLKGDSDRPVHLRSEPTERRPPVRQKQRQRLVLEVPFAQQDGQGAGGAGEVRFSFAPRSGPSRTGATGHADP